ncbi:hypothetical protein Dvina_17025 [Dactylosporangium vinaceum]|uniref:Uncharacterized protein n=1 Tax=Dactylosporangium vinaceum TaxID=53362 RepID=A0ABV5MKC8_9ACTN|nr:hypothetical protein [Dactylosporangium vinaceum]UAB99619.1 hypothetical protein Dvina_17025 [Dactylosporangium vinaceum]
MPATSLAELSKSSIRRRQILPRRHAAGPRPAVPTGGTGLAVAAFAADSASLDPVMASWLSVELGEGPPPEQVLDRVLEALSSL